MMISSNGNIFRVLVFFTSFLCYTIRYPNDHIFISIRSHKETGSVLMECRSAVQDIISFTLLTWFAAEQAWNKFQDTLAFYICSLGLVSMIGGCDNPRTEPTLTFWKVSPKKRISLNFEPNYLNCMIHQLKPSNDRGLYPGQRECFCSQGTPNTQWHTPVGTLLTKQQK